MHLLNFVKVFCLIIQLLSDLKLRCEMERKPSLSRFYYDQDFFFPPKSRVNRGDKIELKCGGIIKKS